jgi:hypothetical protein
MPSKELTNAQLIAKEGVLRSLINVWAAKWTGDGVNKAFARSEFENAVLEAHRGIFSWQEYTGPSLHEALLGNTIADAVFAQECLFPGDLK